MKVTYQLNKNLTGREAIMLNWKLGTVESPIRIISKEEDRIINAKSLVGLLSGCFRSDNIVDILIENDQDADKVKKILNEVGRELN